MPSFRSLEANEIKYRLHQRDLVDDFFKKYSKNKVLIQRIKKKFVRLSIDPYREAERSFHSSKCPKCMKTRVGNYRIIYFIHDSSNEVEIIDVDHRSVIYRKWD